MESNLLDKVSAFCLQLFLCFSDCFFIRAEIGCMKENPDQERQYLSWQELLLTGYLKFPTY